MTTGEIRAFVRPARGSWPAPKPDHYYVGWDVGQSQDFSAISILKKAQGRYTVVHLARLPLGMSYPDQLAQVKALMHRKPLDKAAVTLCIDATGVGKPVLDMAYKEGLAPVGVTIHGGNTTAWDDKRTEAKVPKKDLVSTLVILAQSGSVKIAKGLQHGDLLAKELSDYQIKINPNTTNVSFGNGREAEHDDLVLSVATPLWVGEYQHPPHPPVFRLISVGGRHRW